MNTKTPCPDCGSVDFDSLSSWMRHQAEHQADKERPAHTITPTREELYEALGRATDALEFLLPMAATVYFDDIPKLRICRAVAADVRKMLDARPKL